jgi:hypothetical protein
LWGQATTACEPSVSKAMAGSPALPMPALCTVLPKPQHARSAKALLRVPISSNGTAMPPPARKSVPILSRLRQRGFQELGQFFAPLRGAAEDPSACRRAQKEPLRQVASLQDVRQ